MAPTPTPKLTPPPPMPEADVAGTRSPPAGTVRPVLVTAEFTIEPFVEGDPGAHVHAGLDALRAAGLEPEMEAFGSSVSGELEVISAAVQAMLHAATAAGATQVSLQLRRVPTA